MKRKLQFLTKTLLVAAGLCVGSMSAWADVTYDLVWEENIAKVCTDWGAAANGTVSLTANGSYKNVSVTRNEATHVFNTNLAISVGREAYFMVRYAISSTSYNAGFYYNWNATSTVAVLNVKKDQLVTIRTTSNTVLAATNATANAVSPTSYAHEFNYGGTKTTTYYENVYTVTSDGTVTFTIPNNAYVGYVGVKKIHVEGSCDDPTYNITGANGNARTFTLACATDESSIYYSTSELATATGGTLYSAAVETEATTIWAYAKTASATSSVISFSTGAGSTLTLSTPAISASGFTNTDGVSVNNPTFNFTCDNSSITGKPAATLTYTFTPAGGVESAATAGTSYTPTGYGTLKVIASASGYNSSEKSLVVSNFYIVSYTGRDYTTAATSEIAGATWGEAFTPDWEGWAGGLTASSATLAITDDMHMNISTGNTVSLVSGWGLVRADQKSYGYRVRYINEGGFVALKENTSKGSDDTATEYQTVYCQSGTGLITDYISITAPAAYAVQQLFHYTPSPASESVTVTAAGYATYVSSYNLDFTSTSIKAYEAKVNAGKVVLTPINKVQAGTGVVLYKEGGATESIPVCTDYDTADDNELVAGTGAAVETTDGSYTNYILNNVSGIGFYKANGQTVASNRAYLHTLTANISGGAPLYMFFNDSETTGINAVKGAEFKVNGEYYNLAGQRVAQPTKGLYIVNGRKVVIK